MIIIFLCIYFFSLRKSCKCTSVIVIEGEDLKLQCQQSVTKSNSDLVNKLQNEYLWYVLFYNYKWTLIVLVFWSLLARSYENMKILRNLCLNFARKDGQEGKKSRN